MLSFYDCVVLLFFFFFGFSCMRNKHTEKLTHFSIPTKLAIHKESIKDIAVCIAKILFKNKRQHKYTLYSMNTKIFTPTYIGSTHYNDNYQKKKKTEITHKINDDNDELARVKAWLSKKYHNKMGMHAECRARTRELTPISHWERTYIYMYNIHVW